MLRLKPVRVGNNLTDKGRVSKHWTQKQKWLSLKIWLLFVEECSLGWWQNGDRVILVHCRQKQKSLWGTEDICWRGPCTLTTPLCTGSYKWLATSAVLLVPDGHDRVQIEHLIHHFSTRCCGTLSSSVTWRPYNVVALTLGRVWKVYDKSIAFVADW